MLFAQRRGEEKKLVAFSVNEGRISRRRVSGGRFGDISKGRGAFFFLSPSLSRSWKRGFARSTSSYASPSFSLFFSVFVLAMVLQFRRVIAPSRSLLLFPFSWRRRVAFVDHRGASPLSLGFLRERKYISITVVNRQSGKGGEEREKSCHCAGAFYP